MSLEHRILRFGAAGLTGLLLLAGAAHAALDSTSTAEDAPRAAVAAGADGDKSSKTIELLLQMQDSASAAGSGRNADLSATRTAPRSTGGTAAQGANETDTHGASLGDSPVGEPHSATTFRNEGSGDAGGIVRRVESPLVQSLPVGDRDAIVQPSKALQFFRENRAMAIGAAVALLVLVAVIGARGGRKG